MNLKGKIVMVFSYKTFSNIKYIFEFSEKI